MNHIVGICVVNKLMGRAANPVVFEYVYGKYLHKAGQFGPYVGQYELLVGIATHAHMQRPDLFI
jgi:hypothetical protein